MAGLGSHWFLEVRFPVEVRIVMDLCWWWKDFFRERLLRIKISIFFDFHKVRTNEVLSEILRTTAGSSSGLRTWCDMLMQTQS